MKLNRLFSAVLSAALLIGLCACDPGDPVVIYPSSGAHASPRPSSTSEVPGNSDNLPEGSEPPEATPTPSVPYDKNHRLNADIPKLVDGLELPVVGATGYTSVQLPLYASIPGSRAPSTSTPAPSPSPSQPEPEPTPGGSPAETAPPAQAPEDTESGPADDAPDPVSAQSGTAASAQALSSYSGALTVWEPGTAFLILEEKGSWWRVTRDNVTGWIEHRYCMINLPDVIPSIIYDDANAYSSLFISCGKSIPGVTGEIFYHSLVYNTRLNRQEFVMPILYSAARNICAAQHRALAEGNCLVIYQTFRPYQTQVAVANAVSRMANVDPEVKAGISTSPWSISWFIATGVSNHQQGYALDVSMVKVYETEIRYVGSYPYLYVPHPTELNLDQGVPLQYSSYYEGYRMPTVMHELSMAARSTVSPSSSQLSETMNEPAIALRGYFTASGLTPLASEWWHFNDLAAWRSVSGNPSDGKYEITECLSCVPELASRM